MQIDTRTVEHVAEGAAAESTPLGAKDAPAGHVADGVRQDPSRPGPERKREVPASFATSAGRSNELPVSEVVPGFADVALEDAVLNELRRDAATKGLLIEVELHEGVVTLRGYVDSPDDVVNAEAVASRIPGVVGVRDELKLWVKREASEA